MTIALLAHPTGWLRIHLIKMDDEAAVNRTYCGRLTLDRPVVIHDLPNFDVGHAVVCAKCRSGWEKQNHV